MKRLLFSFLFVLTAIAGWAQEPTTFTQGDFTYTVTDEDAKTVSIAKAEAATLTGALVIPTSVTESGETYAVTSIADYAFQGQSITSVTIPSSIMTIDGWAFRDCYSLTNIRIEDSENALSMTAGYYSPFSANNAYTYITERSVYIGRNLTLSEESQVFDAITSVEFGPNVTTINSWLFYQAAKLSSVTIGNGVTTIGDYAFQEAGTSVEEMVVTMGNGVTSIGEYAFNYCSHLKAVTLPSSLTEIKAYAFQSTGLTRITIPASVTNIGVWAFRDCNSLANIRIEDSSNALSMTAGYWSPFSSNNANTYITERNVYIGRNLTLSETSSVFDGITSVEFGPNVTTISQSMFYQATNLSSATIGSGVTTIGDQAFLGCSKLTSVNIREGVTRIGEQAFHSTGLTSVTIPASVMTIGNEAFNFINALESVTIADSETPLTLENSYYGAFQNGDAGGTRYTKKVYLGRNINNYNNRERTEFDTVEELTVGPKVTTLRPYMFAGCYGLQSVDMTNATSLTSISEYAFADITGITSVKVPWLTPITINENVFASGAYSSAILSVPAGTKEAYAAASIWENFTNIDHWSTLVTLTASTHGSIVTAEATASNSTEQYRQPKEDAVVYTLTADEGYELTALTDNDAAVSPLPTLGEEQTRANTEGEEFVTLNASFTPITYNLTYTLNGGTATNPATYTIETETFTLNNPTKTGYDFAGWKLNGVGEAMMTVTIAQGSTGNLAYTATWTPITYNIVYTMDGGTATPDNPTTYTIETETFTLNNPTKTGHTFKGWKLNGEGDAQMEVTIAQGSTGHLAYTATWQINEYTITFDSNGGSAVDPITQDYGTTVTAPAAPTKTGYDFAGWTPALPATMPAENITVTANWTVKTYTVSITGTGVTADNMNPEYGDNVVITIAEDEDRTLNTLTVNGEDVTTYVVDGQYTIHHVTGNVVVVATFNATKEFITLAQGVGTFSCAQDLNFTGSELKAYIAAGYNKAESQVLLVRVYDVPAGTGLYLKGEADVTYKIPYSTSQAYYVNMLKANLTASSIAKTSGDMSNFLLNKVDGEYGFFAPSETATLGAQKAYLQVPTSFMSGSEARAISIAFEDDGTTNISDFELFTNSNEHLYNLKGQRVEKAGRGLYIKNGKKVVIK
ncbi:MAG: leucine-rich repeat protein [Prevotella sp.]|nr:leucine-rich repeat protein [Prevotella sp.]